MFSLKSSHWMSRLLGNAADPSHARQWLSTQEYHVVFLLFYTFTPPPPLSALRQTICGKGQSAE